MTKKIPVEFDAVIKFIQATLQLEKGRRATEAEVIATALEHYAEEKYGYKRKTTKRLNDIVGISTSSVKSSASHIDKIVYGV